MGQYLQSRSDTGVLGWLYLPVSIASGRLQLRNLASTRLWPVACGPCPHYLLAEFVIQSSHDCSNATSVKTNNLYF